MARATGAKKHTHKYYRMENDPLWYCALCTHYLPTNYKNGSPLGSPSLCWNCGNTYAIDEEAMKHNNPWCSECRLKKTQGINPNDLLQYVAEQTVKARTTFLSAFCQHNNHEKCPKDSGCSCLCHTITTNPDSSSVNTDEDGSLV